MAKYTISIESDYPLMDLMIEEALDGLVRAMPDVATETSITAKDERGCEFYSSVLDGKG